VDLNDQDRFDPAVELIRIRSVKVGFDSNSVLESVRTLLIGQPELQSDCAHRT